MRRDVDNEACAVCGEIPYDNERRLLIDGKLRRSFCSQACLRIGVNMHKIARRKARLRHAALWVLLGLAVGGAVYLRHRLLRLRPGPSIAWSPPLAPPPAPEPIALGPHWPPTDEEWQAELDRAAWVNPLPGPERRAPTACARLFAVEPAHARCRSAGRCAVDLGGELWGEHVYAARDGVVERLQRADDAPGGVYVRIAHDGGAVLTHYFHLAAVPTRLAVGARVEAGDVIGLVGDSGTSDGRAHLHFALSVRPSSALPEVYWDPQPLMATWPLHTPERGSVAGLLAAEAPPERVAGTPSLRTPPRVR